MSEPDKTTVLHPVVKKLEEEAIQQYRAKHPCGPAWQELADVTRAMWVDYAENLRQKEPL